MLPELECRRGLLFIAARGARHRRRIGHTPRGLLAFLLCLALGLVSAGCSGNVSSGVKAGSISVTNSSGKTGAVTQLSILDTLQLSMTPSNDSLNAGVDWTVTCGGNPRTGSTTGGACGTLVPAHTADGVATVYTAPSVVPINQAVTIIATVTSNPSQSSSLTLTIVPSSINVSISLTSTLTPPNTLQTNQSVGIAATVVDDPLNAGVTWTATCGSPACGAFSATTYTAPSAIPAGNTVTITATSVTDSTKSASIVLTIVAAPPPSNSITVSVAPSNVYVTASSGPSPSATLIATVDNDAALEGVDWSLSCGSSSCGTITSHTGSGGSAIYAAPSSAPAGGAVTITAKSTSDSAVSASATAYFPALSLTQAPPATMNAATQASVSATVANGGAESGVSWSVCQAAPSGSNAPPSDCGNPLYGYVYPPQTASGAVATYVAPPVAPGTSVVVQATSVAISSLSTASGAIAITPNTTPSVSFIPSLPAKVQPNGTVNLMAAVTNDTTNGGVDWQVCADNCGYFTIQPAIPAIPATATTPYQAPIPPVIATSVSGWPSGTPLPYTAPPQMPASGNVSILAAAHVDNTKAVSGTIAISTDSSGPALNGTVMVGITEPGVTGTSQPVAGSLVSLYSAGANGTVNKITNGVVEIEYSVQATQIASTTTGKDGSFTIPAGYTCPSPSSQLYLVAAGGSVGTNSPNADLVLMTALGSCSNLSSTPVVVNEVTTVASAFATGPFSANDALYGTSSYLFLGTSPTNITGLVNAFAAVNNLVDITTGQARFVTPAGNGTVPYAYINFFADLLNACTVTSGGVEGDGTACGTLLFGTDLLNVKGLVSGRSSDPYLGSSAAPADTLQAVFNLAQVARYNGGYTQLGNYQINIGSNLPNLFNLVTSASPFQPIQTVTGNAGSALSIHYVGGGGISSASKVGSLATDPSGNVWITDSNTGTIAEWNAVGATVMGAQNQGVQGSPFPTVSGGGPMAIDASGNIWVSGNGELAEITPYGTQAPGSPFKGIASGGSDMAIDQQGYIWIANYSGVAEFDNTGTLRSPVGGWVNPGINNILSIGVDDSSNYNIWASSGTGELAELSNSEGQLIASTSSGAGGFILPQMAADGKGNMYVLSEANADFCPDIAPYAGQGLANFGLYGKCFQENQSTSGVSIIPVSQGQGLAFDGRGTLWIADSGGNSSLPGLDAFYPNAAWSGAVGNSSGSSSTAAPSLAVGTLRVAIDGSGNIWVLLSDNSVTEFVGEATPVVAPVALGLKNNKVAAMP